jgi:hypothetical protein
MRVKVDSHLGGSRRHVLGTWNYGKKAAAFYI